MQGYEYHPFAEIFPIDEGPNLWALAEDIKANGQQEPAMLFEGKLLDGRRRELACIRAEVELRVDQFCGNEDEALAYVISKNLHRRHLNENQRALVAAKIASLGEGRPCKETASIDAVSQGRAAATMNVSRSSVQRAKKVQKKGIRKLKKAVEKGDLSVSAAAGIADLPKEEQVAALNGQPVEKVIKDSVGHAVPEACKIPFENLERFTALDSLAQKLQAGIDELSRLPGGECLVRCLRPIGSEGKTINKSEHLASLKRDLKGARPHSVCPYCQGKALKLCRGCSGFGWVTKTTWDSTEDHIKAKL